MSYSSPSPVLYAPPGGGGGGGSGGGVPIGHHGPSTPIIPSPQDQSGDLNFNLIKNVNSGGGIQFHDQNLNHIVPLNAESAHHSHLNSKLSLFLFL